MVARASTPSPRAAARRSRVPGAALGLSSVVLLRLPRRAGLAIRVAGAGPGVPAGVRVLGVRGIVGRRAGRRIGAGVAFEIGQGFRAVTVAATVGDGAR